MDVAAADTLDFETVIKETEKAYQIKFDAQTICWLPKSQIRIIDEIIYVPEWLVKDKGLEGFIIK